MSSPDSNRLYSWLWDSHISPRNSKWLQENLSDIDATVKQMIKIIEEDGDSFAKRAEMYYKRRPELMRLVEQFYRAYRGLAERYSHATGVIRQAHNTMAEAFPDQVPPLILTEDCQTECVSDKNANIAEHLFGFDDEISALESRLACAVEESRQLKERASVEAQLLSDALRRSECEKEDIVIQYKQCVERISLLESELSQTRNDQIQKLKPALASAEAQKDTILTQLNKSATMNRATDDHESSYEVKELMQKLRKTLDNNELLGLEKSVLVTLFGELRQEAAESDKERKFLVENLNMFGEKLNERIDYTSKLENELEGLNVKFRKLSSDNNREIVNNMFLHKMVKQMDTERAILSEQCEEIKAREMALISEILSSSVRETVFAEKGKEFSEISRSTTKEIRILRGKVCSLEDEIVAKKASFVALVEAVEVLRSSFLYLENRARKIINNAEESEESGLCDDDSVELSEGLAKVKDLQKRMKALEKLIDAIGTLRTSENLPSESKCNINDTPDTPKDITLDDKASKLEQHGRNRTDDRMLELWEIDSEGQSIDLTVSKGHHKVDNIVSEIMVVDKLEISKRFIDSYQEENKRKMIEKLESDGLKLTNLNITVHDLMNKVSMIEKSKKKEDRYNIEYNTVKKQLQEANETVTNLFEMNSKLKKAVQDRDDVKPRDGKSEIEFELAWDARRRKILEYANGGGERLTRVQIEVQKIQFLLMKLENEEEKKLKGRSGENGTKFLLKDYLHGKVRAVKLNGVNQSKKKMFCGCINPPTNGDSPRYKRN